MDIFKPTYHFMPDKNWMNDPNGTIQYKGDYHLFYQHNPFGYKWDHMHWGHAKSKDLVHWEHLPIALYPSVELGEKHCFSGCAILNDGIPVIYYTSIGEGNRNASVGPEQWMAISKDDMLTWEKHPNNPLLNLNIHDKMDIKEWRDPYIYRESDLWHMVLGGAHDGKGCVLSYSSEDLIKWTFIGKLYESNDTTIECPNLFKLDDTYVLFYSPCSTVQYRTGTINSENKFLSEVSGIVDYSGFEGFYATNTLVDEKGRTILLVGLQKIHEVTLMAQENGQDFRLFQESLP